ncbi:hypothetical protein, partial [Specibacter sp. RAF43]|uniref:hypothetical protein n=1 Tax=Specibacter sp. RAF43 TaxID=3233057 RepID=UPI003F98BF26
MFPVPVMPAPWADPGQADPALSRPGPGVGARVRMLRAAVPDLPTAPRPHNPAGVVWSPVPGADALAGLDPAALGENDLLDYVHAANRLAAWARGREATALAVFATRRPPLAGEDPATDPAYRSRYADAEIMALYAIGRGRAHTLLDHPGP